MSNKLDECLKTDEIKYSRFPKNKVCSGEFCGVIRKRRASSQFAV